MKDQAPKAPDISGTDISAGSQDLDATSPSATDDLAPAPAHATTAQQAAPAQQATTAHRGTTAHRATTGQATGADTPSSANRNPYAPPPQEPEKAKPRRRKQLILALALPLLTLLLAMGTGVVVGATIEKPEVESLRSFEHRLVTELSDATGSIYQTYSRENRILIQENEMPQLLSDAIMAAEDSRFHLHGGVDLKGIFRAAWTNFKAGRTEEGASTLTMQVARQVFLHRKREWKRKIEEAFLAVELEKRYSKQQILTLWANLQNLGHGNYGMEAAARDYFNKSVHELSISEAATLAGIPNRPSYLAIRTRPEEVKKRRDHVLSRMRTEGYISEEEYQEARAEPILAVPRRREKQLGPYFAEEVRRYLSQTYGTTALYDRGLKVETTMDPVIQDAAEDALRSSLLRLDHLKGWRGAKENLGTEEDLAEKRLPSWLGGGIEVGEWYEGLVVAVDGKKADVRIEDDTYELTTKGIRWTGRKRVKDVVKPGDVAWFRLDQPLDKEGNAKGDPFLVLEQEPELEGAVLVLESATGAIRAMVGGWDYDRNEFNRISQARRQVGSAFKAFVFGAALENGYTAADTLFDGPAVFLGADNSESYSPRNYYRRYFGITTLRRAMEASYNVTAVKLLDLVGGEQVIEFARRCGIQSELQPFPSLALGAADLTPLELAAAYATFINRGIYVEPYLIEKISNSSGRVIEVHSPRAHQAMDPRDAFVMAQMLNGVTVRGTAAALAQLPVQLAGKTGTTNDYTDAWFVGFSPKYTILSWVGYDKKRSIGRNMTGAVAAMPIWRKVVERGLEEGWIAEGGTFEQPPGIVEKLIEPRTGLLVQPEAISSPLTEFFVEGNAPEKFYDDEAARVIELPWYLQEPFYLPKEGERMPSQIRDWAMVREVWINKSRKNQG